MPGDEIDTDPVFRALADPTRRLLLDRLRGHNGQTLRELCARVGMTRQSATQHLDVLVRAGLVTVVRRGRERLHYLNPVPLHEIAQRWISEFDRPRLQTISAIKNQAEEQAMTEPTPTVPTFVYVTYIRAGAQQVWQALTDADLTARYWGHANVSDWQPGSTWEHRRVDGSGQVDVVGRVVEAEPPTRLVITFEDSPDAAPRRTASFVTFLVEPHQDLPNREMLGGISAGGPAVLANLKALLETGDVLPQAPWSMSPAHA